MTDLALQILDDGKVDLVFEGGDLQLTESLLPSVILSISCHRRASETDTLPDASGNRRGWWADVYGDPAFPLGSRSWLLSREKQLPRVLANVQDYDQESLAWLVNDKAVREVQCVATAPGDGSLQRVITVAGDNTETFTLIQTRGLA